MSDISRAPDVGARALLGEAVAGSSNDAAQREESRFREMENGIHQGGGEAKGNPFAAAFHAARTAMLITDPQQPDNPIVFVNEAFCSLTGYSRGEVIGRNCRFLQGPGTDPEVVDRIRQAVAAGDGIETEILNYRKDGTPFWNCLVISPVRDESGALFYFVGSQQNISANKQAELALIQRTDLLEELVAHRTQDLQAALDQKTALLHEVDHRVKNNLQVISSLVLLKARRIQDEQSQRVLHNLAERISALATVHRLLYSVGDVSRFDLAEFIGDLSTDLSALLPAGQVELALDTEPVSVSAAKAAPIALLTNELVGNAFKHAYPDRRRGRVSIEIAKLGNDLRLVVEDDGIGLKEDSAGHGFGKTLIDMMTRQLKARIEWENANPGTRATVVMPLDSEEAQF